MVKDAFFVTGKGDGEDSGRGVSDEGGMKDVEAAGLGRKAAVGRIELRAFLVIYALSLPLKVQGSTALVVLTAIHAGVVAALFWSLLANAIVATQVVEGGTWSSLVPYYTFTLLIFGLALYLSLDVALGVTDAIGAPSDPPEAPQSISLFVVLSIWPLVCVIIYFGLMAHIVLRILHETRPMHFYILAAFLFVLSQLAWFLLGRVLCTASASKIDGSFITTILETASVGVLFLAWRSITEESWDDDAYYPSSPASPPSPYSCLLISLPHIVIPYFRLASRNPNFRLPRIRNPIPPRNTI
ncbi:Chitin synthase export chaperone [Hypsizygus marmoreus]|uniref:Chitin synthase export chaperone n=1 Tax=Hypsizygus marmoreus TaxID=39966 RepID=A0A369J9W4_HYPMA|nr:Chitin synthase export chaperone [Hypsizygus marmoreus]